jgi:Flp pilus assembly pilin Flp
VGWKRQVLLIPPPQTTRGKASESYSLQFSSKGNDLDQIKKVKLLAKALPIRYTYDRESFLMDFAAPSLAELNFSDRYPAHRGGGSRRFSIEDTKKGGTRMERLKNRIAGTYLRIREDRKGQGYTEYVILLALIALVAYAAVKALGVNISTVYTNVSGSV